MGQSVDPSPRRVAGLHQEIPHDRFNLERQRLNHKNPTKLPPPSPSSTSSSRPRPTPFIYYLQMLLVNRSRYDNFSLKYY